METNKIFKSSKYSIYNSAKPILQIKNFFRVNHNNKFHQNIKKINNQNDCRYHYEIYYSSRSKSKERESETSFINKPKIILNKLPPEFNINSNNNNYINKLNDETLFITNNNNNYNNNYNKKETTKINNFLLKTKTETKLKNIKINKTNSLTNIHIGNNNKLSYISSELSQNNNNNNNIIINNIAKKNNNLNHFRTEGSEFETTQENTNTKNVGFNNNYTSTAFKPFNIYNIKNAGKTVLKYDKIDYNNTCLSEIEENISKKNEKNPKRKINNCKIKEKNEKLINILDTDKKIEKKVKNENMIKPIKLNNYNYNYQRKVIPPIMKNDKITFENESLFSKKETQISHLNNINYYKFQKNRSNSNLNLLEQPGKTFTNFKNDIKSNFDGEKKSLPVKNINNNITKKKEKIKLRGGSEDNNKINQKINKNIYINEKNQINKKIEDLILSKNIPKNLNEGLYFRYCNGYKYYFDLTNIDCYILKEIPNNIINIIKRLIDDWNINYPKIRNYLKILGYKKYNSQTNYTLILEHPTGGENFNDIINSIGFYDIKLLLNISQIIYENLSLIKRDKNNMNIIFCLCDIYLNINNHIKIIPPFIRNLQINSKNKNGLCQCKILINKIINLLNYDKNKICLVSLGVSLLQLITQNLLFKMKSINYLINKQNYNNIIKYKKCCFIDTIFNIESTICDINNDLLLSNFTKLYPECVSDFIHICTNFTYFDNFNVIYKHEFLNMYDVNSHIEVYTKEIHKIITFDSIYNNNILSYKSFLERFKILYKQLKIDPYIFNKVFHHKKIMYNLIRAFNMNKNSDSDILLKIIQQEIL